MKGGFEGSLFGAAVWVLASTENISAMDVGCECEPGADKPAYAKIAAAVVLSVSETHPAFCRSLGKLQEPGAYFASGSHRELNRVKEGPHECMAR
jgi:hypothetical protein